MKTGLHIVRSGIVKFPQSHHWWIGALIFVVAMALADVAFNAGSPLWLLLFDADASSNITISSNGIHADVAWVSLLANRLVSDMSMGIAAVVIVYNLYKRWFWRYDKSLGVPVLEPSRQGVIEYPGPNGEVCRKECSIRIDQQMDIVQMKLFTTETQSTTLVGRFVEECGEPVLYYVYRIRELGFDRKGDSKLGAAMLFLDVNETLEGIYWTNEGRSGKLYFCGRSDSRGKTAAQSAVSLHKLAPTALLGEEKWIEDARLVALFDKVAANAHKDFSGLGIIICDEGFDLRRCKSLRPQGVSCDRLNIYREDAAGILIGRCRKRHSGHDGFLLVDAGGYVIGTSQYLFPPFPSDFPPDFHRGTRSYSALCGSSLDGVRAIGIMSEDKSYAVYCKGRCVVDSKMMEGD